MKVCFGSIIIALFVVLSTDVLVYSQVNRGLSKGRKSQSKTGYSNRVNEGEYCDSLKDIVYSAPCEMLSNLGDSIFLHRYISWECLPGVARTFRAASGIAPNFQSGSHELNYYNLSLGKSLFKHDLIMWSRYFGCPDTVALKARKYGHFNSYEYHDIEHHNKVINTNPGHKIYIDTTILD